jgi:hypothetical protein
VPPSACPSVSFAVAVELLSAAKGHKAITAARQMLEAAAALGIITLIGESAYVGIGGTAWTGDTINKYDYPDIEFRWNEEPNEPEAQAVHTAPSGDQTVYRRCDWDKPTFRR